MLIVWSFMDVVEKWVIIKSKHFCFDKRWNNKNVIKSCSTLIILNKTIILFFAGSFFIMPPKNVEVCFFIWKSIYFILKFRYFDIIRMSLGFYSILKTSKGLAWRMYKINDKKLTSKSIFLTMYVEPIRTSSFVYSRVINYWGYQLIKLSLWFLLKILVWLGFWLRYIILIKCFDFNFNFTSNYIFFVQVKAPLLFQ